MKYWGLYKLYLAKQFLSQGEDIQNLSYYRNQLFFYIILYSLAFSPLAIVPGIIVSYITGYFELVLLNINTFIFLLVLGLTKSIKIENRKKMFIAAFFIVGWVLLSTLKLEGPGLLYLFSITIISFLIHSGKVAYTIIAINSVILILLGVNIELKWLSLGITEGQTMARWFGIIVNLIFVSVVITACFEILFEKLEKIIVQQRRLNQIIKEDNEKILLAQNFLKTKNEELNQFAHTVAHDLKEPIRSMQSFAYLITDKYKENIPTKGQEYLSYIQNSSSRMGLLLDSLLEYSQLGKDRESSTFLVENIVKELEKDLSELIRENKAKIKYQNLPEITAYEIEFKMLLQNLIANAIKFKKADQGSEVMIEAVENDEFWEFRVHDNGIGIDPLHQEKIFTIFQRLHKNLFPGTGLGLANCKKIVEIHGGRIWVDSTPKKGSTFHFTISKNLEVQFTKSE